MMALDDDADEDHRLTAYIWRHAEHLMTDLEHRTGVAFYWLEHVVRAAHPAAEEINLKCAKHDPEVAAALRENPSTFRRRVRDRIIAECGDFVVNRCPQCHRVARTSKAKQCFLCGFDWHDAGSTLTA